MSIEISEKTLAWIASDDTGVSSRTLFSCYFHIPITSKSSFGNHPHDPSDFRRCKRFLDTLTPEEKKTALLNVSAASPEWKALVENWDRLEAMYGDKNTWSALFTEIDKITDGVSK
jgi:hypothetical protein